MSNINRNTLTAEESVKVLNSAVPHVVKYLADGASAIARQLHNIKAGFRVWRGLAPEGAIPTDKGPDSKLPIPYFVHGNKGAKLLYSASDKATDITIDQSLNMVDSITMLVAALLQVAFPGDPADAKSYFSEGFRAACDAAGFETVKPPRGFVAKPSLANVVARIISDMGEDGKEFPILAFKRKATDPSRLARFACSDSKRQQDAKRKGSTALTCPTLNLAGETWSEILVGKPCYLASIMGVASPCGGKGTILAPTVKVDSASKADETKVEAKADKPLTKTQAKRERKAAKAAAKTAKVEAAPASDVVTGTGTVNAPPAGGETEDVKVVENVA